MHHSGFRGVIAPILTPFNDDYSFASDLYVGHAKSLLDQGCAALAPFGTTGEALSVGIDERIAAIDALIEGGIDPGLLIPGTGLSNTPDTARLSRACFERGVAAVMTLPPFYYKDVSDDGLFDYFSGLVDVLGTDASIFLYHIPPIAIVGVSVELARRLHTAYPEQIVGIKDSSGDWGNTRQLLDIAGLIVYPGSELPLIEALELGAPGCITATANVNAANIVRVIELFDAGDRQQARELQASVKACRMAIQQYSPIAAQKRLLAMRTGDERWANVRPPLTPMDELTGRQLAASLRSQTAMLAG